MTTAVGLRPGKARRRVRSAPLHSAGLALATAGAAMVAASVVDLLADGDDAVALALPGLVLILAGAGVRTVTAVPRRLPARSAFAAMAAGWVTICLAGAVPYLTTGALDRLDEAVFESVAGFTTTAATVFPRVETLSDGVLFWRALTQWVGGFGVIVLAAAVLPYLGVGGMSLLRSDLPPASEYLAVRVMQTARRLWALYAGFTVAVTALYLALGMDLLDGVGHAFATVSTGGLSTRDGGFAAFDSAGLEWVAAVAMFLAGTNMVLLWWTARGRPGSLLRSTEFRAYALVVVVLTVAVTAWNEGGLRTAAFTVTSVVSTTGFAVEDWGRWVQPAQAALLVVMVVGAMSASAGGGSKMLRMLALISHARRETSRHVHRHLVAVVRIGHDAVPEDTVSRILGYYGIYFMAVVGGAVAVAAFEVDVVTSLSAVISALSNVGPALGELSPGGGYAGFDAGARDVLAFLMLLGRVEIYPLLLGLASAGNAAAATSWSPRTRSMRPWRHRR